MTTVGRLLGAAAAVALCGATAACGSSSTATSGPAASCPGTASASGAPASQTIGETDSNKFSPASVNAKVGDVVEFKNTGASGTHTATFSDNDCLSSGTMNAGDTWQIKFTQAGTYSYVCKFHVSLGMQGKIVVS